MLSAVAATTPVSPMWAATRATGIVALVLLTGTLVLGITAAAGLTTTRWPRFVSQDLHRNLSLLCVALIAVHVLTTIWDGYVPVGLIDAVVPFHSPYRTVYVGLGAVAFDLFLALLVTSGLRHRIGFAAWRGVHWMAYLCWPIAMVHSLGTGTDARNHLVTFIDVVCGAAVLAASLAWVVRRRDLQPNVRAAGAVGAILAVLAIVVFAAAGPLRAGWARRAAPAAPSTVAALAAATPTAVTPAAGR
ncbi:ferric reductase-like transmembrane domain-containing protein [Acidiferrimicrobium sp. IK]|uniref:ferric reductase-like transmembrane domain-containing protein n=1 Tax=Acidiferrimicrobium sp. IK TaxID=2871700 RepID=UPI0021CB2CD6|nr:ferric reductase-like transmembrane domain-containing protein [Acidiferrimicrobium sp. IK]MCU4186519.1 ferric reductase-like transmembrane domain-containing protein [Acidiferrimicrobium sp. IK]